MLSKESCEACRAGAPKVTESEFPALLEQLPGWTVKIREGVPQLEKSYIFENFMLAMKFANNVADLAEQEFHHPAITVEWGKCSITWWTHKISGLHRNDFILAARCDTLAKKE